MSHGPSTLDSTLERPAASHTNALLRTEKTRLSGFKLSDLLHRGNLAYVDQALVSGVNFLTAIVLARALGLQEFGRFSLIWMVVQFLNTLQSSLVIVPMMSIGPLQTETDRAAYDGAILVQQGLLSLVLVGGLWLLGGLASMLGGSAFGVWLPQGMLEPLNAILWPLLAVVLGCQWQECLRRLFFSREHPGKALLNDVVSYLGQFAVLLSLLAAAGLPGIPPLTMITVLWVIAGSSGVAVAVGLLMLGPIQIDLTTIRSVCARHWRFSRWLLASGMLQWLSASYLILTAGWVLGAAAVGAIKAAQSLIGLTHVLFNGLSNIVPIRLGQALTRQGFDAMEHTLWRISLTGGSITAALMIPAMFFAEPLLALVYGADYGEFGWVLRVFVAVYLLMFLIQQMSFGLRALECTRPIFIGYLLTALVSVLFAGALVERGGIAGVMWGMVGLNLINFGTLAWGYRTRRRKAATAQKS